MVFALLRKPINRKGRARRKAYQPLERNRHIITPDIVKTVRFMIRMLPRTESRRMEQLKRSTAAAKGMSFQTVTEKTA